LLVSGVATQGAGVCLVFALREARDEKEGVMMLSTSSGEGVAHELFGNFLQQYLYVGYQWAGVLPVFPEQMWCFDGGVYHA
jgi:hypothetical protein